MQVPDAYSHVVRQAAHDATRAVLAAPLNSAEGSMALRAVVAWLADAHGPAAVRDLAEELAVDLAEAFAALAAVEQGEALATADAWFHDALPPG